MLYRCQKKLNNQIKTVLSLSNIDAIIDNNVII